LEKKIGDKENLKGVQAFIVYFHPKIVEVRGLEKWMAVFKSRLQLNLGCKSNHPYTNLSFTT